LKSDIEIARESALLPVEDIAATLGILKDEIIPFGRHIAKLPLSIMNRLEDRPDGKLVLVTAMTPTPKGEGKTTTTIGLGQALKRIGEKTAIAIREPSLGPCLGMKGGAAGGGYSQVIPMEDINLHFTGDIHAVTTAHNLLAALIDNHLHQKSTPEINPRQIAWKRVLDMNDRSLRSILVGLDGKGSNGVMREDGFEITAASEIMAILCLSSGISDLKRRIGKCIIGYDFHRKPVTASDIGAQGSMTALLKQAINPNLVQSIEGVPVFIHGGPFANIAHGCNSVVATRMALKLADYTVTEAGFGADLGAEKFFHIKCRNTGMLPSAAVLVATVRACALHGIENLFKHVENIRAFNVPAIVSINRFDEDTDNQLDALKKQCLDNGVEAVISDVREKGGEGGLELAEKICVICNRPPDLKFLYDTDAPIEEKIRILATTLYGAAKVDFSSKAKKEIAVIENMGPGSLPVCMAKTPASLTDNSKINGCPSGFTITVTSAKLCAGAGFVVIYTGEILAMPGLPRAPAALNIDIDDSGNISGLF
jgi:formate--tetrahydrofolate ligase